MRHALVPVHLIHSARTAATATAYARFDADPEPEELDARRSGRSRWGRQARRPRRVATRTRRARA